MFDTYTLLVTLHVVLFAYWLGGDFGVFVTSRFIVRPDLPVAERERFLQALMDIDILPRSAIVLLPVVGIQLAYLRGSMVVAQGIVVAAWLIGLAWLTVVWLAYLNQRSPAGAIWQRVDVIWRVFLIAGLVLTALVSLQGSGPVTSDWVAAKLLVYAALLVVGLYLRVAIRGWREGFRQLRSGNSGPAVEAIFSGARQRSKYAAFVFWALIVVMAWLGIAQPF